jgi:alpha-mannosidase
MDLPQRRPLPFTFGNHMHWVDMQWLWGYQVLPGSIDDTLALCRAVGARGNVNFDAVGYEKLAAEDPAALHRLRDAVQAGTIEVTGGSYGQPYGLFVGGESNVRQRIFGARTVRRLCGVWPRTFWEEEFDFCPQLPQILRGCGFTGASLFFQWTWHTPAVPEEAVPLVQWEGVDGTRLPTLAKTQLCLHQWPEDFDGRLEIAARSERPALVQWLELMPSKDWMCRSELLLPRLRELFADPRFAIEPCTAGELIGKLDDGSAPVRRYTMDDVFHGMTIGKNGDAVPRSSDEVEAAILAAEALAASMGLCGRPYASWDVYPAWELDEAWRELLAAQHHDNHECEGLCGSVGKASFARARALATSVRERHEQLLARQVAVDGDRTVVTNPCGFTRRIDIEPPGGTGDADRGRTRIAVEVPPFGWATFGWATIARGDAATVVRHPRRVEAMPGGGFELSAQGVRACIDAHGRLARLASDDAAFAVAIGGLRLRRGGADHAFGTPVIDLEDQRVRVAYRGGDHDVELRFDIDDHGAHLAIRIDRLPRPDPGFAGALRLVLGGLGSLDLRHDTPYAVTGIAARGAHVRKYPSGDWMTSEQWFEPVAGAFTARSFVDARRSDGTGLLCVHDGSQGWFRRGDDLEVVLHAWDPWDEDRWGDPAASGGWAGHFHFVPHAGIAASECARRTDGCRRSLGGGTATGPSGTFPATFGPLVCEPANVLVTAFHREHRKAFEHVDDAFGPEVRNPYVVRLVEYDGVPADVVLKVAGPCPLAAKTDLLGRVEKPLAAEPCTPPPWSPPGLPWSALRFRLRPREIATVMLDLELGRHVSRDLDEHRHVWATVHRR